MKKALSLAIAATTAISVTSSAKAPSADLRIAGTVRPNACELNLIGGNQLNWSHSELSPVGEYRMLAPKSAQFSIRCYAPTQIALVIRDSQSDSVMASAASQPDQSPYAYGLGYSSGHKIGAYLVNIEHDAMYVDNVPAHLFTGKRSVDGWTNASGEETPVANTTYHYTWGTTESAPRPYALLTAALRITPYLNKASELLLADEINANGLMTLELEYQ